MHCGMCLFLVPRDSPFTEIVTLGANALRVRWLALSQNVARGIVLEYKILHRLHGNSSCQENVLNAMFHEFVIQGQITDDFLYLLLLLVFVVVAAPSVVVIQFE